MKKLILFSILFAVCFSINSQIPGQWEKLNALNSNGASDNIWSLYSFHKDTILCKNEEGILFSGDGGRNFKFILQNPSISNASRYNYSKKRNQKQLFSAHKRLFISNNAGVDLDEIILPLELFEPGDAIYGCYISSEGFYILTIINHGFIISKDEGMSWKKVATDLVCSNFRFSPDNTWYAFRYNRYNIGPDDPEAGYYSTKDQGENWTKLSNFSFGDFSFLPNSNDILIYKWREFFISKDQGLSRQPIFTPAISFVRNFVVDEESTVIVADEKQSKLSFLISNDLLKTFHFFPEIVDSIMVANQTLPFRGFGVLQLSEDNNIFCINGAGLFRYSMTTNEIKNYLDALPMSLPDDVLLYPNPSSESVILQLPNGLQGDSRFVLSDSKGMIHFEQELKSGDSCFRLIWGKLFSGIYFFTVFDKKKNIVGAGKIRIVN